MTELTLGGFVPEGAWDWLGLALCLPWLPVAWHGLRFLACGVPPDEPWEGADSGEAALAVLIPARDEEDAVGACLEGLLAQDVPFRAWLLDDGSKDGTAAIARAAAAADSSGRLEGLAVPEPPPGWVGKVHALERGLEAADAAGGFEWILVLDADVVLAPGCLRRALAQASSSGADQLSLLPDMASPNPAVASALAVWMVGASFLFDLAKVEDPDDDTAFAVGGFFLARRGSLEKIGAWDCVSGEVVEDLVLALVMKEAGLHLVLRPGRGLLVTEMYSSLADLWTGFTKNTHRALGDRPAVTWLAAGSLLLGGVMPLPTALLVGAPWMWAAAGCQCLGLAAAAWMMRIPRWWILLVAVSGPLGALYAAAILVGSMRLDRGGGVHWKGRRYASTGQTPG